MTGRERILAAFAGKPADRLPLMPITMMLSADRLGVRYRQYASDFKTLAEAQARIAEEFHFDHVSAISDPARESSDLGAGVAWFDDQPPAILESRALLAEKTSLAGLRIPDPSAGPRMSDRVRGVELLRRNVGREKLVEGWVEGPCALAADLRGLNTLMLDFYDDPGFVRGLFDFVGETGLRFGLAQLNAGADLIGVGDAAASLIGPKFYRDFVLPYEKRLIQGLQAAGGLVRLHICGSTRKLFKDMASLGAELVDLDWMAPISEAREQMGERQTLAGNIDPVRVLRDGTPDSIAAALAECHRQARIRYIVCAGCEVPRGTPEANLRAMTCYAETHTQNL